MLLFDLSDDAPLKLSDLRLALFGYVLASQRGVRFGLKIDDNISGKNKARYDELNRQILEKFALQSDFVLFGNEYHDKFAQILSQLYQQNKSLLWKKDDNSIVTLQPQESISVPDAISGDIVLAASDIGDVKLFDTNGRVFLPAVEALSDMIAGITLVIRYRYDLLLSAAEIYLHRLLGYKGEIEYLHLPAPHDPDPFVSDLLVEGFLPDAIIAYLLKPWSGDRDWTIADAVTNLDIAKTPVTFEPFDTENLEEINSRYLFSMDSKQLSSLYGFADHDVGEAIKLFLPFANTISVLDGWIEAMWKPKVCDEDMRRVCTLVHDAPYFDNYDDLLNYLSQKSGVEKSKIEISLQKLLTGSRKGPKAEKLYPYIKSYLLEVAKCQH